MSLVVILCLQLHVVLVAPHAFTDQTKQEDKRNEYFNFNSSVHCQTNFDCNMCCFMCWCWCRNLEIEQMISYKFTIKTKPNTVITKPKKVRTYRKKIKSHKQIETEAKQERKKQRLQRLNNPTKATYTPHATKPVQIKNQPVIAPVQIKDIRYCRLRGFLLQYCTRAADGSAEPVVLTFERYEEAVQAFCEAVVTQRM